MYLKERNFCVDLFSRVISFNVSREFDFANWLPVDFSWGFIFANLSFVNVLYILTFSWFVLLFFSESRNSYPNFSIFQVALFGYKRLNSRRRSKGAVIIKRFTFFFLCCLHLYCLISCKVFLTWPLLIDREPSVKM